MRVRLPHALLTLVDTLVCTLLPAHCYAGPVDAAYKAVDSLIKVPAQLTDYSVSSVTEGIEALATTRVIIKPADGSAVSEHATRGKVNRSFSGAGLRGGWGGGGSWAAAASLADADVPGGI